MLKHLSVVLVLSLLCAQGALAQDTESEKPAKKVSINDIDIENVSMEELSQMDLDVSNISSETLKRISAKHFGKPMGSHTIYPDEKLVMDPEGNTYNYYRDSPEQQSYDEMLKSADLSELEMLIAGRTKILTKDDFTKYIGQDYSGLLKMLRDPVYWESWGDIGVALGIVGDEAVVDHLIEYLEEKPGRKLSNQEILWSIQAKEGAIIGLGYAISRHNSDKALKWLESSILGNRWWKSMANSPFEAKRAAGYAGSLNIMNLAALSKAGTPGSIAALKKYRSKIGTPGNQVKLGWGDGDVSNDYSIVDRYIKDAEQNMAKKEPATVK